MARDEATERDGTKTDAATGATARELAQDALDAYADGMNGTGDKLARKAVAMDRDAVVEVVQEIDEAADDGSKDR